MKNIQRISSIIIYLIIGISIIVALLYYFGGNAKDSVGGMVEKKFTDLALIWTVVLFAVATILTLAYSLINVFTNKKAVINFLMILGFAVVLVAISYILASSEPLAKVQVDVPPTPTTLKLVGTALNATFILTGIAFLSILVSEIYRAFK